MSDVRVSISALSDVGMQRAGNEDSFLVADLTSGGADAGSQINTHQLGERGSLMIVSDGMGGAAAGEIASEMAVTTIRESIDEMPASTEIARQLKSAAEIANERIWNHAQNNPELFGMGATLTAALVQGNTAYLAQVGDSRAYLIRGEQIKQLTKDQSLAQMLVDSGTIKPDQMANIPQNVIMQALGTQPVVKVVMSAVELFRNDCLVICSDGLSNKVAADELRRTINESDDLTGACRALIEKANERGGEDNITVIIARFDGEALHSVSEGKTITGSFRALDQGFYSEYFASGGSSQESGTEMEVLGVASTNATQAEAIPPASAEEDNDFSERPTAERPVAEAAFSQAPAPKKRGYGLILIITLISLLLIGATGFFFYSKYLKSRPLPANVEQPPE